MNCPNHLYWNCASGIFNKIDIIKMKVNEHLPEIFYIAESDLNKKINIEMLNSKNYNFTTSLTIKDERKSRICAFYKNNWAINETFMTNDDEIIIFEKGNDTSIGIYRPFKLLQGETATTNLLRLLLSLQNYLDKNKEKNVTITRDFNIDYLKIQPIHKKKHYRNTFGLPNKK